MSKDEHSPVTVRSEGRGKLRTDSTVDEFNLISDKPAASGGSGAGPDPYGYLMNALGACKGMTMTLYAARKQWPLDGYEIHVRHAKESGIDKFTCDVTLKGSLDPEQRARLIEIAGRCPVHLTMQSDHCVIETREKGAPPSGTPQTPAP